MGINTTIDGGFRLGRSIITSNGVVSDIDLTAKLHLDELNVLLGKRIFGKRIVVEENAKKDAGGGAKDLAQAGGLEHKLADAGRRPALDEPNQQVLPLLKPPLTAKRTPGGWREDSLAHGLDAAKEEPGALTLVEYIDQVAGLSEMKYAYESNLSGNWALYEPNFKFALNAYPAIRDYLVVYGVTVMKVTDLNGLKNFILNNKAGVKAVIDYAAVSAARTYINSQKLIVKDFDDDASAFVVAVKKAGLSLTASAFTPALKKLINGFVFNGEQEANYAKADIGVIPPELKPQLIQMMKNSKVKITDKNVNLFLPLFITQLTGTPTAVDASTPGDVDAADQDFSVEFLQDTDAVVHVSRSAVLCAAQLFYGMVLGDELDVFSTVNYFTHSYLLRGGIEIQDSTLRDDLQQYVFSNRFTDLKTRKIADRTRPAERQMFYRQVFNGGGDLGQDNDLAKILVPNTEFVKLWKVLILESAKYIERAQKAFYPDTYVSRQNVMQAVEDLQYNLSTHCIGMVNVVSPLIYAELNFVIKRIFMHKEVMGQIVPAGGTWWRVVETLYLGMRNERPRATILYNKARLGCDIIRRIAEYNTASFEDNVKFSAFISDVEAYITTQSIIQQDAGGDADAADTTSEEQAPSPMGGVRGGAYRGTPVMAGVPAGSAASNGNGNGNGKGGGSSGDGEWDF